MTTVYGDSKFELADLRGLKLPLLDEPMPPSMRPHGKARAEVWSVTIADFDA